MIGASGDSDGGEAGDEEGGRGGRDGQGGKAGAMADDGTAGTIDTVEDAGSAGMGGEPSFETELEITKPNLGSGKTYLPFTGKISAHGAAHYDWKLTGGVLPAGFTLQGTQSDTVTLAGTPTEAGEFPLGLSVTDGTVTKTVDVTLVITHSALFLSDRNTTGVNELFLTEVGGAAASTPVRLSASIPAGGGITNYAWSPDGSKVMYVAAQSSGGAAELWVASLASPGTAQRVSAQGASIRQISWLASGNIGAYATSTGDLYLVDLSNSAPGASKAAISGSTEEISGLLPSPNGTSLIVARTPPNAFYMTFTYVTWTAATPKVVPADEGMEWPSYSYDGRFTTSTESGVGRMVDLSLASPTATATLGWSFSGKWCPDAPILLYSNRDESDLPAKLYRGALDSAVFAPMALVDGNTCTSMVVAPWSPNTKNGVFTCDRDLRAITNVATATPNTDFSLLPGGFASHTFTDLGHVAWAPDSAWVGLVLDRDVDKQNDLYLIRYSAPGTAYKAHNNSIAQGVSTYTFAPNSHSVAFVGTISPQPNSGLYVTKLPSSGAPPLATLVSSPANAIVQSDINWAPGSRVLTYRASVSGTTQLFALPVAADGTAGTPISISGVSGSGVNSYQLAPTRSH